VILAKDLKRLVNRRVSFVNEISQSLLPGHQSFYSYETSVTCAYRSFQDPNSRKTRALGHEVLRTKGNRPSFSLSKVLFQQRRACARHGGRIDRPTRAKSKAYRARFATTAGLPGHVTPASSHGVGETRALYL
jgi:hypothetical protein